jgi:uncharacterized protein YecE (DUF72 family)
LTASSDLFGDALPAPGARRRDATPGPAAIDADTAALGAALPAAIRLGTSSWSFPGWAGLVYDRPAGEALLARHGLPAYTRHPLLRAVGLDRAFYKPLSAAGYASLAAQVPEDFRFLVKAPAAVTDAVRRDEDGRGVRANPGFLDAELAAAEFVRPAMAGLDGNAGPLVFQFSPLPRADLADVPRMVARLHAFLAGVRERCGGFTRAPLLAVEVRDAELLTRDFAAALKDTGARYCLGVHARMPSAEAQLPLLRALWPGPLVARWNLHAGRRYESARADYAPFNRLVEEDPDTRATLARVALATARAGHDVTIVANNKAEGSAPLTLAKLAEAIVAASAGAPTS